MEALSKELKEDVKEKRNQEKWWKKCWVFFRKWNEKGGGIQIKKGNRVSLVLNKISNEYGTNWVRGVLFTFILGLIFCVISHLGLLYQCDTIKWDFVLRQFTSSFNPLRPINTPYFRRSGFNYLFIASSFIGRIFISYGIFQTIQAFRKYGKNGI